MSRSRMRAIKRRGERDPCRDGTSAPPGRHGCSSAHETRACGCDDGCLVGMYASRRSLSDVRGKSRTSRTVCREHGLTRQCYGVASASPNHPRDRPRMTGASGAAPCGQFGAWHPGPARAWTAGKRHRCNLSTPVIRAHRPCVQHIFPEVSVPYSTCYVHSLVSVFEDFHIVWTSVWMDSAERRTWGARERR